jgi:hypothetical protein
LNIAIKRVVPESAKPRKIAINNVTSTKTIAAELPQAA